MSAIECFFDTGDHIDFTDEMNRLQGQREKVRTIKKALQVPQNLSPQKPSIQHQTGRGRSIPTIRQQKVLPQLRSVLLNTWN